MYRKLAVPLDGSPFAEKVLPYVQQLAHLLEVQVLLIRVTELPESMFEEYEEEVRILKDMEGYLARVKVSLSDPGAKLYLAPDRVDTLAVIGKGEEELAEVALSQGADLLVMATHGRTGLIRLVMGSVAASVIKQSVLPVVLIHPDNLTQVESPSQSAPLISGPIVVALDGTPKAEMVLEAATTLARQTGTKVHLVEVVNEVSLGELYGLTDQNPALEEKLKQAQYYLEKLAARIKAKGVNASTEVRQGHPSRQIIECASEQAAFMLAMATHARGVLGQLLWGSVTEEVLRQSHLPLLLVPILKPEPVKEKVAELENRVAETA